MVPPERQNATPLRPVQFASFTAVTLGAATGALAAPAGGMVAAGLVTTAVSFTSGYISGGMSGEGEWDQDKAVARGLGMAATSLGILMSAMGGGQVMSIISAGIMGAGQGAVGSLEDGQTVDWSRYWKSALVGGASAAVQAAVAGGYGRLAGGGFMGQVLGGSVSGGVGAFVSHALSVELGLVEDNAKTRAAAERSIQAGMLGGALGAAVSWGLARGMVHEEGALAGSLRCDVSETDFVMRHALGGAIGGGIGDALGQGAEYLGLSESERAGWRFDWGRLTQGTLIGGASGAAAAKLSTQGKSKTWAP